MADTIEMKEREPFSRRVLLPVGVSLIAWTLLNVTTSHLEWFGSGRVYRAAATILYPMLGITIEFSSVFIYSVMYIRGSSITERLLWSYAVPFVFIVKEVWRVSAYFSPGESFYYALAPMNLGLIVFFQIGFLALCEMFWRWRDNKKGRSIRIITPGPIAGLAIMVVAAYFMFFWGILSDTPGTKWFYLYMEGYKALFLH
jgi:hypothetical protein